ncbi:hypothetical protein SeLEV6574_g03407 [Synchytrium endobioticum]|uniref:Uncharacterized protein n=1 Tax=Synchytrium endobioticum TaxID=286115 RepID=A0A507D472_9FUNG|nr:hypothetical protein SeLEV6574_g03407 [Synchytrium endobioticum]
MSRNRAAHANEHRAPRWICASQSGPWMSNLLQNNEQSGQPLPAAILFALPDRAPPRSRSRPTRQSNRKPPMSSTSPSQVPAATDVLEVDRVRLAELVRQLAIAQAQKQHLELEAAAERAEKVKVKAQLNQLQQTDFDVQVENEILAAKLKEAQDLLKRYDVESDETGSKIPVNTIRSSPDLVPAEERLRTVQAEVARLAQLVADSRQNNLTMQAFTDSRSAASSKLTKQAPPPFTSPIPKQSNAPPDSIPPTKAAAIDDTVESDVSTARLVATLSDISIVPHASTSKPKTRNVQSNDVASRPPRAPSPESKPVIVGDGDPLLRYRLSLRKLPPSKPQSSPTTLRSLAQVAETVQEQKKRKQEPSLLQQSSFASHNNASNDNSSLLDSASMNWLSNLTQQMIQENPEFKPNMKSLNNVLNDIVARNNRVDTPPPKSDYQAEASRIEMGSPPMNAADKSPERVVEQLLAESRKHFILPVGNKENHSVVYSKNMDDDAEDDEVVMPQPPSNIKSKLSQPWDLDNNFADDSMKRNGKVITRPGEKPPRIDKRDEAASTIHILRDAATSPARESPTPMPRRASFLDQSEDIDQHNRHMQQDLRNHLPNNFATSWSTANARSMPSPVSPVSKPPASTPRLSLRRQQQNAMPQQSESSKVCPMCCPVAVASCSVCAKSSRATMNTSIRPAPASLETHAQPCIRTGEEYLALQSDASYLFKGDTSMSQGILDVVTEMECSLHSGSSVNSHDGRRSAKGNLSNGQSDKGNYGGNGSFKVHPTSTSGSMHQSYGLLPQFGTALDDDLDALGEVISSLNGLC